MLIVGMDLTERKLAILGLGYVGLPLAVEFAKVRPVIGFDIDLQRITSLKSGVDVTNEVSSQELAAVNNLIFTSCISDISFCDIFIVTVPTPIDEHNAPDFSYLIAASESIGRILKTGDVVIYESTVYPGAIEEICVKILEKASGLVFNTDFFVGYSPERVSPGDSVRRIPEIKKLTSGSTSEIATFVDNLYKEIIVAGTYMVSSIKIAEAAKVIENTQRDLNIALMNELTIIFNLLEIDTEEVLKAAETKWNFLSFRPGLVGGHCIGVDPYYLTYKAKEIGYNPEIILAGRRLNDGMGQYVVARLVKKMLGQNIAINVAKVLIMGVTFKENCPDIRNSKVIDVVRELQTYNIKFDIFDPLASHEEVQNEYNLELISYPDYNAYDAIVLAVSHTEFREFGVEKIRVFGRDNHVLYDLKYIFSPDQSDLRL